MNQGNKIYQKTRSVINSANALFITGYFPLIQGGAEYQAYLLADQIQQQMPVSFVFRNHWGLPNRIRHDGYTLWGIQPNSPKIVAGSFILEALQLYRILKHVAPSTIYIRGANAYALIAALYAEHHPPCRMVWHIAHDNDVSPMAVTNIRNNPFRYIDKKMTRHGVEKSDITIAQTWYQADLSKQNIQKKCDLVIGNWHPVPPPPPSKKTKPVNVLWVANWRPFKQPQVFIKLARRLNNLPNVQFKMIGRTRGDTKMERAAKDAGILLCGELPNASVNQMLAKSHLLVNTSTMEGFSNVFIQAWLNKVPVISLNVDPDGAFSQKKLGYCAKSFDNLVEATKALIQNESSREDIGNRARNYALKHHSLSNISQVKPFFR
jgi:glycosyltransferase involved in cell wall biosynthesis